MEMTNGETNSPQHIRIFEALVNFKSLLHDGNSERVSCHHVHGQMHLLLLAPHLSTVPYNLCIKGLFVHHGVTSEETEHPV